MKKRRQASRSERNFTLLIVCAVSLTGLYNLLPASIRMICLVLTASFFAVTVIVMLLFSIQRARVRTRALKALRLSHIDTMGGVEFEEYVAALFRHQGYEVMNTKRSGDFGVDLVISRGGVKTAVQIKRYKKNVDQDAVRQVVAGMVMRRYNAQRSMVVTNSFFTKTARELADEHRCELIDRERLGEWIADFQNKQ